MLMKPVLLSFFLLLAGALSAQFALAGRVTDAEGFPLPGATVYREGTTTGTYADTTGHFELIARPGDVLVASFVGFGEEIQFVTEEMLNDGRAPDMVLRTGVNLPEIVLYGRSQVDGENCYARGCGRPVRLSAWSDATVPTTAAVAAVAYPNPFTGQLTLLVPAELGDPAAITLRITNVSGRTVRLYPAGSIPQNTSGGLLPDRLGSLVPGTYFVSLIAPGGEVRTFSVVRHRP